jgi:hypothetical protein
MKKIIMPLNPYKDGTCRTIKAQYHQSSRANFIRQDGLGATGVIEFYETEGDIRTIEE